MTDKEGVARLGVRHGSAPVELGIPALLETTPKVALVSSGISFPRMSGA